MEGDGKLLAVSKTPGKNAWVTGGIKVSEESKKLSAEAPERKIGNTGHHNGQRKPKGMNILQETFESSLMEILSNEDAIDNLEDLKAKIASEIPELADSIAESMLATIKQDAQTGLKEKWEQQRLFEEKHRKHWQKPLELLDLFISLATGAGDEFNKAFRDEAARSNDAMFKALTLLHARGCQVASATLVLLRSGYADDAHARWRALHEISVVSHFIKKGCQDLAERYLLHDNIQRYRLALKHHKHAEAIDAEPISQEELDELKAERDKLVAQFGKPFKENYGWAASALGKGRPNIYDIEKSVDLEHWRPYYGMASDNVHANAHGAYYRLGLGLHSNEVLLAGPSNMGLADPGHSTAISLCQVTTVMLTTRPNLDAIVTSKILLTLEKEIGGAFLRAHRELEGLGKTAGWQYDAPRQ